MYKERANKPKGSQKEISMMNFENVKFELNEKGEMKQNVRNAFKADVMAELFEMFQNAGLEVFKVSEGVAVNFANADLGAIAVVFNGVVKSTEFDAEFEAEMFAKELSEKAEKVANAEKAKAEKIALQNAEKEAKAKLKEKKAK
jgi:hypothetical protein